jgi:CRP-like cAMP-binding protein
MNEFDALRNYLNKVDSLSKEDIDTFSNYFEKRIIKKKQFVIQPDFIAKYRIYVAEGAFRAYVIDEDGQEHTISLAMEDWWISDPNSYYFQTPATMFVQALEDSVILQLDFETEAMLKEKSQKFEPFFRFTAERGFAFTQRRLIASLTLSAEDRYKEFIRTHPDFIQRIPQYVVASYLGMTTEYLSRIRKKS